MTGPDRHDLAPGHAAYDELAAGYALSALEPAEEDEFVHHLAGCATCTWTVSDLRAVAAEMAAGVVQVPPPPAVLAALRDRTPLPREADDPAALPLPLPPLRLAEIFEDPVDRSEQRMVTAARHPHPHARRVPRRTRVLAAAAAVVVLAAGAGVTAWATRGGGRPTVSVAQDRLLGLLRDPQTRDVALAATPGSAGTARVLVSGDRLYVSTDGVAPNDDQHSTYVLWALHDGRTEGIRAFDVTGRGQQLTDLGTLPSGATTAAGFAVSYESGRGVPAEPTRVVLS